MAATGWTLDQPNQSTRQFYDYIGLSPVAIVNYETPDIQLDRYPLRGAIEE